MREPTHLIHPTIPGQEALRAGGRPMQACDPFIEHAGYRGPDAEICLKCQARKWALKWPDLFR